MIANSSHAQTRQIRTDFVSYSNRAGLRLAACLDHVGELRDRPWIIIAPKYGETKKSNLQLSYHLAVNGLNVLRFDHTCHVGESEGLMLDFTLPGAVDDISASIDFLQANFGVNQVVLVANSLSARCALRVAAHDSRVAKFISVAGVVNLLGTIEEIYREDILTQYREGRRWGVTNFLGFEVHGDAFLETLVAAGLHDLTGTIADANKLRIPLIYFYAERDAWVCREDVKQVVAANSQARLIVVQSAMHEVRENPQAAEQLFLKLSGRACMKVNVHAMPRRNSRRRTKKIFWSRIAANVNACVARKHRVKVKRNFGPVISRNTVFWNVPLNIRNTSS